MFTWQFQGPLGGLRERDRPAQAVRQGALADAAPPEGAARRLPPEEGARPGQPLRPLRRRARPLPRQPQQGAQVHRRVPRPPPRQPQVRWIHGCGF